MMTSSPRSGKNQAPRAPILDQLPLDSLPLDNLELEIDPFGWDQKSAAASSGMALDTIPLDTGVLDLEKQPASLNTNKDDLPEPLGFRQRLAQKERDERRGRAPRPEERLSIKELEDRARPKSSQICLTGTSNRRRLPLSKVGQGDESPSFYLSLSDLMSLLLVFFVLIFSMSEISVGNSTEKKGAESQPVAVQEIDASEPVEEIPAVSGPLTKPMVRASAQVVDLEGRAAPKAPKGNRSTGGPLDLTSMGGLPGMTREQGPVNLGLVVATFDAPGNPSTADKPGRKPNLRPKAARGLSVDRSLLAMVTMSKPAPQMGLPEKRAKAPAAKPASKPAVNQKLGKLSRDIQPALSQGMRLTTAPDRLIISLPESILFSLGEAKIKTNMHKKLALLAVKLNHHVGYKVVITGHTDDIPISNKRFASNWELSAARAAAVGRSLLAQGVDRRRLIIKGMADTRPVAPNNTDLNREQNRRVEIELHPV